MTQSGSIFGGPSQKYSGVIDQRSVITELLSIIGFSKIQFGSVSFNWAGVSTEAEKQKILLEPVAVGAQAFTTIYANTLGRGTIAFIASLTESELELGCITSTGGAPPGGSKQTVAWMVISP